LGERHAPSDRPDLQQFFENKLADTRPSVGKQIIGETELALKHSFKMAEQPPK
jgi:hypothetical protein